MATDKSTNLKLLEATKEFAAALVEINQKLDTILAALKAPESKVQEAGRAVERKVKYDR